MAINAYVGLPGHGKSYGAVENVIIPALKNKRLVYTNIPMVHEKCLDAFGMAPIPFHTDDIVKNPNWWTDVFTAGAVFVLDEVWRLWPAGLKANNVRETDKVFLAEHRHMVGENGFSTEIYLVTQDLSQVASFARALVETTFRMVKRSNIGLDNRFRVDVYLGAVTGSKPPASQREREIHGGKFRKEIYQYYKSHTKSETGQAGDESKTDKRGNALGRLSIKLGIAFFVIAIIGIYYGSQRVTGSYGSPQQAVPDNPVDQRQPSTPQPQKRKPKEPPFLSKSKKLFVSHTIQTGQQVAFFFRVVFDDYTVLLTDADMIALGYRTVVVNGCVVRVRGHDYEGFAMCAQDREPKGFAEKFVAGASGSLSPDD